MKQGIRKSGICLALVMMLLCAAACAEPICVTDMKDRVITLDAPAGRIVALTAADCEILCALGAGDTLVGRGAYCDYPEEILSVPAVQSGYETNIEQIIALQPQVVLMNTMAQTRESVEALEQAGIRVVVSEAADIEGVYQAIAMIGAVAGKQQEAAALIDSMKQDFAALAQRAQDGAGRTVYFEISPLKWGLFTAGRGTFMQEIADMLNVKNIFDDLDGWPQVSEEQVISRAPDYIVTTDVYLGEGDTPAQEIMARPGWQDIPAVREGHVFNADPNTTTRPGPRLVEAARELYEFFYGGAE